MRHSPTSILHFLANHYEVLKKLFDSCKTSRIVTPEQLNQLHLTNYTSKLVDYKIIRELPRGAYRFEERYFDFLSFLVSDFSLDLPIQLAKYRQSLSSLFLQLQQATETEKVRFISQKIIQELLAFLAHLEDNTEALSQEVDMLRNAKKDEISYTQQVNKATYLITNFLEPLNLILDQHEESIIELIRTMIKYAHDKLLKALDSHERDPYASLHIHLRMAEEEVQKHLKILVDTLLPLLDQIKIGSPILKGLKLLRDYYSKGKDERYQALLPKLHEKRPRNSPIKCTYEMAAEDAISIFVQQKPLLIYHSEAVKDIWYFREGYYQKKLAESLPIDNFFLWCYETLQKEEAIPINLHMFFKMASLLFKSRFKTTFNPEQETLQLADTKISTPHIRVTNI